MHPMDYISSRDLCYLICDILEAINPEPVVHGKRVAYMLIRMLENKGGYDEYQIAEFAFLAMIHDIGAYYTDKNKNPENYDFENAQKHAAYGSVFLRQYSPFGERCDILKYHHMLPVEAQKLNYKHVNVVKYLSFLEYVDKQFLIDGTEMSMKAFEPEVGSKYSPTDIVLLLKCIKQNKMLEKLVSDEYLDELWDYMDEVIFTNEEKEMLLSMAVQCFSFKRPQMTIDALCCSEVVLFLADEMSIISREKERLSYAAMLRDIGFLKILDSLVYSDSKLLNDEIVLWRKHVEETEDFLNKRDMDRMLIDTAINHHERLNGTGFPNKKTKNDFTKSQKILQVADCLVELQSIGGKPKKTKDEILEFLRIQKDAKLLDDKIIEILTKNYDIVYDTEMSIVENFEMMEEDIEDSYNKSIIN